MTYKNWMNELERVSLSSFFLFPLFPVIRVDIFLIAIKHKTMILTSDNIFLTPMTADETELFSIIYSISFLTTLFFDREVSEGRF